VNDASRIDTATLLVLLTDRLCEEVQNRPVATLAGAAVAGYVLAAGVPAFVVRAGAGIALRGIATRVFAELTESVSVVESSARSAPPSSGSDGVEVRSAAARAEGDRIDDAEPDEARPGKQAADTAQRRAEA
jgi:hypothetical protein